MTGDITMGGDIIAASIGSGTGTMMVWDSADDKFKRAASSRRFKNSIGELDFDSEKIYDLVPHSFNWNADRGGSRDFGLIAEEVNEHIPQLVPKDAENNCESVHYHLLAVPMIAEMKKLRDQNAMLMARLDALEARCKCGQ